MNTLSGIGNSPVNNVSLALLLTIVSELIVFFLLIKPRQPQDKSLVWLIFIIGLNCVSNPLAHVFYATVYGHGLSIPILLLTEVLVILFELLLIKIVMLKSFKTALVYSLVLNITSIIVGELLCWLKLLPWCY